MRGLSFFRRTSANNVVNLASWHSPHSLTWRWSLSFSWPRSDEGRMIGAYRYSHNCGWNAGLQFFRCQLTLAVQKPMWYRALWQHKRDENEDLKHQVHALQRELDALQHVAAREAHGEELSRLN